MPRIPTYTMNCLSRQLHLKTTTETFIMENGSINPSEVATLSLLGGGGGYGYGGRGGYGHGREFANDSSNAVRIRGAERLASAEHDAISQQSSDNADRNRDLARQQADNAQFIANRDFQTQIGFQLSNQVARGEDNQNANFNSLSREMAANAREAAKCCCEAKLLAATNQAKTDAGIAALLANQECTTKVADAVANATQNAKLDILLAERSHGGNG